VLLDLEEEEHSLGMLSSKFSRLVLLCQRTATSQEKYEQLALALVTLESVVVIPVKDSMEAARFIALLHKRKIIITSRPECPVQDANLEESLLAIPKVTRANVQRLLQAFGTIYKIANASEEELISKGGLGRAAAQSVWCFFRQPLHQ